MKEIAFLGHVISGKGISVDPKKVEVVVNWEVPTNVTEIRSFLGMASYYKRFMEEFSQIAHPLTKLTQKNGRLLQEICGGIFSKLFIYLETDQKIFLLLLCHAPLELSHSGSVTLFKIKNIIIHHQFNPGSNLTI